MFRHVWSVLCERISTDKNTNLVSFLSCVENINVRKLPVNMRNLSLGMRWVKEGEKEELLKLSISLIRPDATEELLFKGEQKIEKYGFRCNLILNGMPIKEIGTHTFKIQMYSDNKWTTVQEIPLTVSVKTTTKTIGKSELPEKKSRRRRIS